MKRSIFWRYRAALQAMSSEHQSLTWAVEVASAAMFLLDALAAVIVFRSPSAGLALAPSIVITCIIMLAVYTCWHIRIYAPALEVVYNDPDSYRSI